MDEVTQALIQAVRDDRVDDAETLIGHGANVNATLQFSLPLLIFVLHKRNVEMVRLFLDRGATPLPLALFMVISRGDVEMTRLLVEHGADVNARRHIGLTPLMIAVRKRSLEIVRLLVSHGANVNLQDIHGRTALHVAVECNVPHLVQQLLQVDCDLTLMSNGETPLMLALRLRDADITWGIRVERRTWIINVITIAVWYSSLDSVLDVELLF